MLQDVEKSWGGKVPKNYVQEADFKIRQMMQHVYKIWWSHTLPGAIKIENVKMLKMTINKKPKECFRYNLDLKLYKASRETL